MKLSTVILPVFPWREGRAVWRRAEELGLHAAYTYDHLTWQSFRGTPWHGTVPTLAAAAAVTERIRLGTMVASPNFRHPVPFAKELMTLDELSGGRFTLGIGAGGEGFDATVLNEERWSAKERGYRFAEFTRLLDRLLSEDETTETAGAYYRAFEAEMLPGSTQRPRMPFHVAAIGPRAMRLTAELGQGWITFGASEDGPKVVAEQIGRLREACAEQGRDGVAGLELTLLNMGRSETERPLASFEAFVDWAGRYREVGITELVLHWPIPDTEFAADLEVFERIATEGLAHVDG
ncbi:MAG TPA: LLM class flavin-dependent oxidoreductase [Actinospica sp.]|jgi:alkanesulfonate monooxygenase SsuD/methylene tetrahydromethanopterin reductase-like flavin-dependent oxidoreductase (luciferase family)|nr:LLM class flavin-dependent oxidoreductase [Actinospica sp.]